MMIRCSTLVVGAGLVAGLHANASAATANLADPFRKQFVVTGALGPYSTVSGSNTFSSQGAGGGGGTLDMSYAGRLFWFSPGFEWNGPTLGAAASLGFATGGGVWTGEFFGTKFETKPKQGSFVLGGEFDFAPVRNPGTFFGFGPAFEYRSVTETTSTNCGSGVGAGANEEVWSGGVFRVGAAARLRHWIKRKFCVRANAHLLLLGGGGLTIEDSCPGNPSQAWDANTIMPSILLEGGLAIRFTDLFSLAGDLGLHYQSATYVYTAAGVTGESKLSYLEFYLLPRITAQFNF